MNSSNHSINTKLGKIEYSIEGKGKAVIFLHGGHSNSKEKLAHKGFDLTKFQLITPSRPGYGDTPLGDNKSPKQAANLITALLDELKIEQATIYGISAGGLTAIELTSNYPDRVEKLILASAVSKEWLDKKGKLYKTAKKLFQPNTAQFIWGMINFFSGLMPILIAKNFYSEFTTNPKHKLQNADVKELMAIFKNYKSGKGFINDIEQNINDGVITQIKCPTLIIHSKNDNSVSFEHALHSHKMIENSKLIALDNEWGHLIWIGKDAQDSIAKVIDFISESL